MTLLKIVTVAALIAGPTLTATAASAPAPQGWEQTAMRVPAAQRLAQGKGVTVAVLDTGVVAGHPEFRGRVTSGPDYIGGGARPGQPYWGEHGTSMTSSVLKVAPQSRVLSVRVIWDHLDPARKKVDEFIKDNDFKSAEKVGKPGNALAKGIHYAVDKGAKVISMSLGSDEWGWGGYEDDTAAAVDYALGKGVILLASAGNGGSTDRNDIDANNVVSYPAAYPGVIGVAASGPTGRRADFSQVHTYTTIAAPGVDIWAANNKGAYDSGNGTSPACALAAGTVALMLSRNPDLTPRQVRDILVTTAKRPTATYTTFLGFGVIDAAAAVQAAGGAKAVKAVPYKGKKYFGQGPTDQTTKNAPLDTEYLVIGGVAAGIGLICLVGAFFLLRRRSSAKSGHRR
ncbi:S8 family serine peptidase [Nonomuraea sp. NPDC049152]|uniref:S8 family peptidase n=1 Tax=Nonomuraea sp. NPDC049152 TaxID=3154350 RepID=UPI0033ED304E